MYKLVYDPADQAGGDELADELRFTPNPVQAGNSVVLDVGAQAFLTQLRIIDMSGRLVHDASFSGVEAPYEWSTSGMKSGTYIVEAWSAGNDLPIRGKLSVIRP